MQISHMAFNVAKQYHVVMLCDYICGPLTFCYLDYVIPTTTCYTNRKCRHTRVAVGCTFIQKILVGCTPDPSASRVHNRRDD